jgi:hypothetical protein
MFNAREDSSSQRLLLYRYWTILKAIPVKMINQIIIL